MNASELEPSRVPVPGSHTGPLPPPGQSGGLGMRQMGGLIGGPLVLTAVLLLPPPEGMPITAWRVAGVALLMAIWWVTEAMPIAATSLLPLALFPLLAILPIQQAAAPYANPTIFLFLGGFVIAFAMERWGLHRRIAFSVVRTIGIQPRRVVLGVMVATAFLSLWVSNTATAVMMLPIGLSVIKLIRPDEMEGEAGRDERNFATTMMLGIAYAATIGGLGTLIGTPPNAFMAGFLLETYGVRIGFGQWMLVGVPLVALLLPLTWFFLTRISFPFDLPEIPGGQETVDREYRLLGPVSLPERWVIGVFVVTAVAWMMRPIYEPFVPGIDDAGIAMIAALVLFAIPLDRRGQEWVMTWEVAERRVPWGVLLLFGGGLSLADAIRSSGLADWIASEVGRFQLSLLVMVFLVTALVVFFTEVTSNTAAAATFLPLVASVAVGMGENPLLLVVPAALAASTGFMMPVGTPPNAIAYGSGYVTVPQMVRAGWALNLICVGVIVVVMYTVALVVFGIQVGVLPEWAAG